MKTTTETEPRWPPPSPTNCPTASGTVLVVENDQGVEIEIDDRGCFIATGDERFATTTVNAGGE